MCTTFLSAGIATSISMHVFSFLFLILISGLFALTPVCVYCLIPQHYNIFLFIHWLGHVCVPFAVSVPSVLHIEKCKCAQALLCLINLYPTARHICCSTWNCSPYERTVCVALLAFKSLHMCGNKRL